MAYRSGRLDAIGFESGKTSLRPDGKKTDREVSPEAKRKEARDPIARTPLKHKRWKRY